MTTGRSRSGRQQLDPEIRHRPEVRLVVRPDENAELEVKRSATSVPNSTMGTRATKASIFARRLAPRGRLPARCTPTSSSA